MYYVYILRSLTNRRKTYVGYSRNPEKRLERHNEGLVPSSSQFKPWKTIWYCGFYDEKMAKNFELYLKGGSGRAFSKRHLV